MIDIMIRVLRPEVIKMDNVAADGLLTVGIAHNYLYIHYILYLLFISYVFIHIFMYICHTHVCIHI